MKFYLSIGLALILSACDVGSSDTVSTNSTGQTGNVYSGNFVGDRSGEAKIIVEANGNFSGTLSGGTEIVGSIDSAGVVKGALFAPGALVAEMAGNRDGAGVISGFVNVHNENGIDEDASFRLIPSGTGSLPSKNVVATYKGNFDGLIAGAGTIRVESNNYFTGEFSTVRILGYINSNGGVEGSMYAPGNPAMSISGNLNGGVISGDWNIFNHNAQNDGTFSLSKI